MQSGVGDKEHEDAAGEEVRERWKVILIIAVVVDVRLGVVGLVAVELVIVGGGRFGFLRTEMFSIFDPQS